MPVYVMMLFLTVINYSTGDTLYQEKRQFDNVVVCMDIGLKRAGILTAEYKKDYPMASTNVNCKWEQNANH